MKNRAKNKKLYSCLVFALLTFCLIIPNISAASSSEIFFGVHTGFEYSGLPGEQVSLERFESDAGKKVSIVSIGGGTWWYDTFSWGDFDTLLNNGKEGDKNNKVNEIRKHGSIPLIIWKPFNPLRTDGSTIQVGDSDYLEQIRKHSLKNIVAGKFDDYIRTWARQIKEWGHPIMFRFLHELNGVAWNISNSQMPQGKAWNARLYDIDGTALNEPADAIKAWRHVVDIFREEGATNVTWIWSVLSWPSSAYGGDNPISMSSIYPGDDYVDWIGIECYNFNPAKWEECNSANIVGAYNEASALSATKPLIMVEMGSREDDSNPNRKAEWIRNALSVLRAQSIPNIFPRIKGVIWWNDSRNNLWIESSKQATQAFKEAIFDGIYSSNDYENLAVSPIPIPKHIENNAQFINQSVPISMIAGQRYNLSITMKNNSSYSWTDEAGYRLGSQNPQGNLIWGVKRVNLGQHDLIAPGQQKTFIFNVTAPFQPGTYNFQWRMLKEFKEWFGDFTPNVAIKVNEKNLEPETLQIVSLSPLSGPVGTEVTIAGSGFAPNGNTVKFGSGYIHNLNSLDNGTKLKFTVPDGLNLCPPNNIPCGIMVYPKVDPGSYSVSVINNKGSSNTLTFLVKELKEAPSEPIEKPTEPSEKPTPTEPPAERPAPTEPPERPIIFQHTLYMGIKNSEVVKLQNFLSRDPAIYPEGLVTGYFGPLTRAAVKRFQCKYGIVCSGDETTTGYGLVGPKTRKKLNELYATQSTTVPTTDKQTKILQLQKQIKQLQDTMNNLLEQLKKILGRS